VIIKTLFFTFSPRVKYCGWNPSNNQDESRKTGLISLKWKKGRFFGLTEILKTINKFFQKKSLLIPCE
jgi:hypothetical protein